MDLQKAQSACEQLSEQLMNAEAAKEKFEAEATNFREDAELARKAKEGTIFLHFYSSISHIGILLLKLFWTILRKIVVVIVKTFEIWGWRRRICKTFEITGIIYSNSERSEQFW